MLLPQSANSLFFPTCVQLCVCPPTMNTTVDIVHCSCCRMNIDTPTCHGQQWPGRSLLNLKRHIKGRSLNQPTLKVKWFSPVLAQSKKPCTTVGGFEAAAVASITEFLCVRIMEAHVNTYVRQGTGFDMFEAAPTRARIWRATEICDLAHSSGLARVAGCYGVETCRSHHRWRLLGLSPTEQILSNHMFHFSKDFLDHWWERGLSRPSKGATAHILQWGTGEVNLDDLGSPSGHSLQKGILHSKQVPELGA